MSPSPPVPSANTFHLLPRCASLSLQLCRSGYLCCQLLTRGAGSLLDLNVHLGEELLAPANLLAQGTVVLNQAQDVAATLAGPQAVARDQAAHV